MFDRDPQRDRGLLTQRAGRDPGQVRPGLWASRPLVSNSGFERSRVTVGLALGAAGVTVALDGMLRY